MPFVNDMAYLGNMISENIAETPEGFLICRDVPIAKVGEQFYTGEEIEEETGKLYKLYRLPEDVFDPNSIASLEGKPITDEHPYRDGKVTPENYRRLAKGHVQNVRRQDEHVIADMIIADPALIKTVRSGKKRGVSVGYRYNMQPHSDAHKQTDIICNHVAIVDRGRGGPTLQVNDSIKKNRSYLMSTQNTKAAMLLAFARNEETSPEAFARALSGMDSATITPSVDDSKTLIQAMQAGFDKMTAALTGKKSKKANDADADGSEKKGEDEEDDETEKRLKAAEDTIATLKAALDAKTKKANDAESDLEAMLDDDGEKKGDDADEDDEDDEEKKKEAHDAAMRSVVLALKPVIAGLPEKHQKSVKDSLRPLIKGVSSGENGYAKIQAAIEQTRKAGNDAQKSAPIDYQKMAADIAKEWEPK